MKFLRSTLASLAIAIVFCFSAMATVSNISGFVSKADGDAVNASLWNSQIGGIYDYINTTLVTTFNLLDTKGGILTHNGSNIVELAPGTNGQFLQSDSGEASGLKFASAVTTTALSTKGDTLAHDGSALVRVPVGTDGQVLTSRAAVTAGVAWETAGLPTGSIVLWSGTIASIPTGYHLCDGTAGTVNLQGLYVVAAGNASPAATGGMGLMNPGGPFGDTSAGSGLGPAHVHSVPFSGAAVGAGSGAVVVGSVSSASTATITPKYYALAYIQKL